MFRAKLLILRVYPAEREPLVGLVSQGIEEKTAAYLGKPLTPELDPDGTPQFRLVAEEVEKVDSDLVVRDDKHQIYSVRYEAVNAMLLNEFLKQHRTVEKQKDEIAGLKARLEKLERKLDQRDACEP